MILTGKTKVHFEKFLHDYLIDNDLQIDRDFFPASLWNTIIIEFFDSVGIHFNRGLSFIKSKPHKCEVYIRDYDKILDQCFDFKGKFLSHSESEATTEAIKKANYLYNEHEI